MKKNLESNEIVWTNNLRVFSTICVIILHVVSPILYQYGSVPKHVWWTANVYDSSVRFCVPIFLMLTGALMLNKKYELTDFLKKRFLRIILPFAFWSLVFVLLDLVYEFLQNYELSLFRIAEIIFNLIKSGGPFHFWYIYMIIGIYLFIPILSKWVQNSNEKEILYFIFIWIISLVISNTILDRFNLSYFTGYIGYLVLGYYLSLKSFKINKRTILWFSSILIVVGVIITMFGTYFLTVNSGRFSDYFYGYLKFNTLMVSVGVFLFFKNINIYNATIIKIISYNNKYSFGIYLVHVLVLRLLFIFGIDYNFVHPIFGIPFTTFTCLLVSSTIIYIINRLPYGKFISG